MGNISKSFNDFEFIPPDIFNSRSLNNLLFISPWQVQFAQFIRDRYDLPVIINDWHWGGQFKESGTRLFTTKTGAKYSQHKLKSALDIKIKGMIADEIREDVMQHQQLFLDQGLSRIESGRLAPTWFHADCALTSNSNKITVFG